MVGNFNKTSSNNFFQQSNLPARNDPSQIKSPYSKANLLAKSTNKGGNPYHNRKLSFNNEKLLRSISPYKGGLMQDKSHSPLRGLRKSPNKIVAPESHRLTITKNNFADFFNTKSKNFAENHNKFVKNKEEKSPKILPNLKIKNSPYKIGKRYHFYLVI